MPGQTRSFFETEGVSLFGNVFLFETSNNLYSEMCGIEQEELEAEHHLERVISYRS